MPIPINADMQHSTREQISYPVDLKTEQTKRWMLEQANQFESDSVEHNEHMVAYWNIRALGNPTDDNAMLQLNIFQAKINRARHSKILSASMPQPCPA